jgi:hypothetical protein
MSSKETNISLKQKLEELFLKEGYWGLYGYKKTIDAIKEWLSQKRQEKCESCKSSGWKFNCKIDDTCPPVTLIDELSEELK